jgi:hypothetical protein
MGIRGLTHFVKDIPKVWTLVDLSDSMLVIDGNNLLFHLYIAHGLDMEYGGQYLEYYQFIRLFFSTLKKNRIEPVVIMDGVDEDDLKLPTLRSRASDRIKEAHRCGRVPPLFIVTVFCQAVFDSDVEVIVCDHEGDMVAAQMAKEWGCPVLSNDSDFYLFDIPAGVIPTDRFCWQQQEKSIPCQCYHRGLFLDHINLAAEFLPLLGVLVGNDLSNSSLLKPLHRYMSFTVSAFRLPRKHRIIDCVINWLHQFDDVQSAEAHLMTHVLDNPDKFSAILEKSKAVMRAFDITKSTLRTMDGALFPDWVIDSLRKTEFAREAIYAACHGQIIMKVQIEDMKRPSSHSCSTPIRQAVYSILFKGTRHHSPAEIVEIGRNDGSVELHDQRVKILTESQLPSLDEVQSLSLNERHDMLLATLNCDPNKFTKLDLNWQLPTAAIYFWSHLKHHHLSNRAVYAVVFCFASCALQLDGLRKSSDICTMPQSPPKPKGDLDMQLAHSFAEFQSILYYTVVLNSVLGFPFPSANIAGLFNGRLAHYMASKYHSYKDFLQESEQPDLFENICQLVDRQEKVMDSAAPLAEKRKQRKKLAPSKASTISPISVSAAGSRFKFLTIEAKKDLDSNDFDANAKNPSMKAEAASKGSIEKTEHQATDCSKVDDLKGKKYQSSKSWGTRMCEV